MLQIVKVYLCFSILIIIITISKISTEKFDDLLEKRCNKNLPKDKSDKCRKCYSDVPNLLRGL